jgi:drug/metabolite transporter (DMT)-like permease
VTLTIQPIGSLILGAVLLSESPTSLQLLGGACIVAGLVAVGLGARSARRSAVAGGEPARATA